MPRSAAQWMCILAGICLLQNSGCTSNPQSREQLDAATQALSAGDRAVDAKQYDQANRSFDQAIRTSDAVIQSGDAGSAAEANYLRGRAYEDSWKPDATRMAHDFSLARTSYLAALGENPTPQLAARLHGQLGGMAYYQDDYPNALRELTISESLPDDADKKQWVLYLMGICQQRLGRFDDADRTFAKVEGEYPGSEAAQHAAARRGVKGFYVQLGAYSQQSDIDSAAAAIVACGNMPMRAREHGLTVIRTADTPSYLEAMRLKERLAVHYPDARVMP